MGSLAVSCVPFTVRYSFTALQNLTPPTSRRTGTVPYGYGSSTSCFRLKQCPKHGQVVHRDHAGAKNTMDAGIYSLVHGGSLLIPVVKVSHTPWDRKERSS